MSINLDESRHKKKPETKKPHSPQSKLDKVQEGDSDSEVSFQHGDYRNLPLQAPPPVYSSLFNRNATIRVNFFSSIIIMQNDVLFRGEITPLSSSYNISGLVPVCWLLFLCF